MRLFGALPIFDKRVSRKQLLLERNGPTFGPRGKYLVCTGYFFTLSVQVHFGVIRCISAFCDISQPCDSKTVGYRAQRSTIWPQ